MKTGDRPSTLPKLLASVVAAHGADDAVVTVGETLSYEELDARSARMARALMAIGAGKGTRIALMAPDGVLWMTAFLASLRIGALVSLTSTLCTAPELAHMLRNSDTQILIGVRSFLRHDYARTLTSALPGLTEEQSGAFRLPCAPYLRSVWLDDAENLDWARSVDELLALADEPNSPDSDLLSAVEQEVAPGDEAVIVYTSGSSSLPKAVVHTQWNVARHPPEIARYVLFKSGDRAMPLLPAFWMGGLSLAMQIVSVGAALVYPESPGLEDVLDSVERFDVNRVLVWQLLGKFREAAIARGIDVEEVVFGLGPNRDKQGHSIPPHLHSNMLGMTESFSQHSGEPLDVRLPEDKAGAAGRAINGYERRVVNPETGEEVAPGEVGELQLRGGALMSGFYKVDRPRVFTPDGFYPTNDLVRIDADGYLFFVGRTGDMIKTKAANVSRLEVEAALRALPEIDLPVVVGLPDPELGQRLVAAVVPSQGETPTEESIKAALRDSLSSYKIPRDIVFIAHADVPLTSTGKIKLYETGDMISALIRRREET